MPDFGIGEAIAAITAFGAEAAAGAGEAGAGLLAATEGGLSAAGGGLADLFGGAGGGLGGLFGTGAADVAATGEAGLVSAAGGLSTPAAAAGGLAPAAAGPVDVASALSADASAFAPTAGSGTADIFSGFGPGAGFSSPGLGGTGFAAPSTGFSAGEVGGFDTANLGFGAGGGGPATGFGGAGGAAGGGTDIASLAGPVANPGGDLAGLTATPGAAGAGANPAAGGAGGGFLDNLGTGALNSITKNPLGIAAAGAGLGYNILAGQKQTPNQQALTGQAQQMAGQGQQLQQYLQNGTLPPGMQQQVDNAKAAARAQIISGYASRGQNADPSQNSALAQELAAVDTNALELQGKIASNLLTAGINETNMSANLFQALIQMDQTQAKQMGSAIANFSSALAGGPKSINIGSATT